MNLLTLQNTLPPCAIPSIPWVKLWCDGYSVSSDSIYQKQSLRNRYAVLGVNGPISLTIPVESTHGIPTSCRDIRIAGTSWRKVHWRTLQSAYARAAFWEHYYSSLQRIFFKDQNFLLDLHLEIMYWLTSNGIVRNIDNPSETKPSLPPLNPDMWEPSYVWPYQEKYIQVFSDRHTFHHNLSIIDLMMNLGPKTILYINRVTV